MDRDFGIDKEICELVNSCEKELKSTFKRIDDICEKNSLKVLR